VYQPVSLKPEEAQQELASLQPDVMIVAAYGLILPKAVLNIPTHGCLNIHASLLPRWRGAAPIQRAIAAGDAETGITIMQMDEGLDTGDMLLKLGTPINADDTGGSLHDRLAEMGGKAIVQALERLANNDLTGEVQNEAEANYAHKLSKEEGHIDWSQNAQEIERLIRAFNPWPGTFTDLGEQRIRIHQASALKQGSDKGPGTVIARGRDGVDVACGNGTLRITSVQLPGSKAQSINDLINGGKQVLLPGQELN
jgi:methionyl-tRNA formyltransferase